MLNKDSRRGSMMLLKGKHIFIVEDNIENRVVYKMVLTMQGAKITFERWGEGTLVLLKQAQRVDLIILDLMLTAGTSGFDIFDTIRSQPEYNAIPIIAVSASEPIHAMAVAQSKGFSGYIAKPIDDGLFPKQLARIIAGNKVWSIDGK